MFRGCVLFAVFQVIFAQGQFPPRVPPNIPQKCLGPPPQVEKPHECCQVPPFFTDEDFAECGFQKLSEGDAAPRPRGPPDCSKQICMLKKYDLLNEEEGIDEEAITKFLDDWGAKNEEFLPVIEIAKDRCVGKNLFGPPQVCEANKIVFCVSSTIFDKCPTWQDTDGCTTLRGYMDDCTPPFNTNN